MNLKVRWTRRRLKFEELFYIQLGLLKMKQIRLEKQKSKVFKNLSPVCGKGTQARKVTTKYRFVWMALCDLLRKQISENASKL